MDTPNITALMASGIKLVDNFETEIEEARLVKSKFEKEIGVLAAYIRQGSFEDVLVEGVKAKVVSIITPNGPDQILNFARWCKKGAGKEAVGQVQKQAKLVKRSKGVVSVAAVSCIGLLDEQLQDWSNERKQATEYREGKIRELTREIERQRVRLGETLSQIDAAYVPASKYDAPKYEEILRACWTNWVQKKIDAGIPEPRGVEDNYLKCVHEEGDNFLLAWKAEFVQDEDKKEALVEYGQKKISHFREIYDRRAAENMERLLVGCGAQPVTAVPIGTPPAGGRPGPSGQDLVTHSPGGVPSFKSPIGERVFTGAGGSGVEPEAGSEQPVAPEGPPPEASRRKQPSRSHRR